MKKVIFILFLTSLVCDYICASVDAVIEIYKQREKVCTPANSKVILVGGCFDVLHYGHMQFLEQARAEGTYLIVALEPDESIIQYKKRKPIHNQKQRAYNLAQLRSVDKVLLLPSLKGYQDYNQLVQDVHPDVIAITADDPQKQNKLKQAKDSKAQLKVVIERLKGFSTTKIIQGYNSCNSKGKRVV